MRTALVSIRTSLALLPLLACAGAGAQEPPTPPASLTVSVPTRIEPLAEPVHLRIEGQEIDPGSVAYQIRVFGQDVTASVVESQQLVSGADVDGDGRLEDYVLEITADLSNLPLEQLDNALVLEVDAASSGAPLHESATGGIEVPVAAFAEIGEWEVGAGHPLRFRVHWWGVYEPEWTFTLEKNGQDVTQTASWTQRIETDVLDRDGKVVHRDEVVEIDPASLPLEPGDKLSMRVTAHVLFDGQILDLPVLVAVLHAITAAEQAQLEQALRPCVDAFVQATGLHDENGRVVFGASFEGDASSTSQLADAARALAKCLLASGQLGAGAVLVTSRDGLVFLIHKGTTNGNADVVVSVNEHGGNAKAENGSPGGAAVAVGGDGGAGQPGGNGTSITSGGASLAAGGNGGDGLKNQDGPAGGDAKAIETSGQGQAFAEGGAGGTKADPNSPSTSHGDGGGADVGKDVEFKKRPHHGEPGGDGNTSTAGTGGKAWFLGGVAGGVAGSP